jgi:hypothetical protein
VEKGEGGTGATNEDGVAMDEPELESEEGVTNGEREEKSIVAVRDSGCCAAA